MSDDKFTVAQGFTVAVDQLHHTIDIRVRWREGMKPDELSTDLAKACGRAAEELLRRLEP